jgi:hypothetical protein
MTRKTVRAALLMPVVPPTAAADWIIADDKVEGSRGFMNWHDPHWIRPTKKKKIIEKGPNILKMWGLERLEVLNEEKELEIMYEEWKRRLSFEGLSNKRSPLS